MSSGGLERARELLKHCEMPWAAVAPCPELSMRQDTVCHG